MPNRHLKLALSKTKLLTLPIIPFLRTKVFENYSLLHIPDASHQEIFSLLPLECIQNQNTSHTFTASIGSRRIVSSLGYCTSLLPDLPAFDVFLLLTGLSAAVSLQNVN